MPAGDTAGWPEVSRTLCSPKRTVTPAPDPLIRLSSLLTQKEGVGIRPDPPGPPPAPGGAALAPTPGLPQGQAPAEGPGFPAGSESVPSPARGSLPVTPGPVKPPTPPRGRGRPRTLLPGPVTAPSVSPRSPARDRGPLAPGGGGLPQARPAPPAPIAPPGPRPAALAGSPGTCMTSGPRLRSTPVPPPRCRRPCPAALPGAAARWGRGRSPARRGRRGPMPRPELEGAAEPPGSHDRGRNAAPLPSHRRRCRDLSPRPRRHRVAIEPARVTAPGGGGERGRGNASRAGYDGSCSPGRARDHGKCSLGPAPPASRLLPAAPGAAAPFSAAGTAAAARGLRHITLVSRLGDSRLRTGPNRRYQ